MLFANVHLQCTGTRRMPPAGENLGGLLLGECSAVIDLDKERGSPMSLIEMFLFAISLNVPAWVLVIALVACAVVLCGWMSEHKNLKVDLAIQEHIHLYSQEVHAEEAEQAETQRKAYQETISVLQAQLARLEHVMWGRDGVREDTQFTQETENLTQQDEARDGALTVWYEITHVRLKQEALGGWDAVVAYAFESSPRFLMGFYQESLKKYEDEYATAMQLLADEGECAQREAIEHIIISMKHWGFWRALNVAMNRERDVHLVRAAYVQFLRDVEWKVPHCLQELKQVMDTSFDDQFARPQKLFS